MTDEEQSATLARITEMFESGGTFHHEQVREWMHSPSMQVRWAAVDLLLEHSDRVDGLSDEEKNDFLLEHLTNEIRVSVADSSSPGPYMTGHSLRAWFERLWEEQTSNKALLTKLRNKLADLTTSDDPRTRDVVITAVLEHLFSRPDIAAFFGVWRDDPRLSDVYEEALHLAQT